MRRADPGPGRKRKPKPKPLRSRAALREFLDAGGKLVKTLPPQPKAKTLWVDPETDRVVSVSLVRWAVGEGLLQGAGDGLFDDRTSQTFIRKIA